MRLGKWLKKLFVLLNIEVRRKYFQPRCQGKKKRPWTRVLSFLSVSYVNFIISLNSVKSSIEVVVTFEDLVIQILNELRCDRLWPIRRHCHYEQVYLLATFSSTLTKSASLCTTAALSFMLMSIIGVCTLRKRNFTTEVTKFSKKICFQMVRRLSVSSIFVPVWRPFLKTPGNLPGSKSNS